MITGDFAAVWPRVFAETVDWLRSRGFDRHTAEDAAQEAGARAFDRDIPFSSAEDLTPWIRVVARRLARDANRKTARIGDDAADPVEREDVATVVEWRMALAAAAEAFVRLSESDQAAIIEGVVGEQQPDRRKAVRLAVRRHRARTRLLALLEALVGTVLALGRRGRRLLVPLVAIPALAVIPLLVPHGDPQVVGHSVLDTAVREARVTVVESDVRPQRSSDSTDRVMGTESPTATTTPPVARADLPGPAGEAVGTTTVETWPKRDNEPLVCAGTRVTGTVCVPSPLNH